MSKEKITREDIEKKTDELCEMIKKFKDGKSDAAEYVCYQVVTWACENHYEGIGILTETLIKWRNESIEAMDEDDVEKEKLIEEDDNATSDDPKDLKN